MENNKAPLCKICSNPVKRDYANKCWRTYCSKECKHKDLKCLTQKRKDTCLEKYGCDNPFKNKNIQEKQKKTCLKKYGVDNVFKHTNVRKKARQVCLDRYGTENPASLIEIQQKVQQTKQEKYGDLHYTNKHKAAQTLFERYGVTHNWKQGKLRDKQIQTMVERYGVEYSGLSENLVKKRQQTCLEKYGTEHPGKSDVIKTKIKQTNLERYGATTFLNSVKGRNTVRMSNMKKYGTVYPSQHPDIRDKIRTTSMLTFGVPHHNQHHFKHVYDLLNNYEWLYDQYITQNKTASQISRELDCITTHILCNYLRKQEIAIRYTYTYSYKCINWLLYISDKDKISIQHAANSETEYKIPNTKYRADGYCVETNTIYEFYGDYWHGNPTVYDPTIINETVGCSMGELYNHTVERELTLKSLGYSVISIWESEWDEMNKLNEENTNE